MKKEGYRQMHLFLTGEKGAGKSTVIRDFITQSGLTADGFLTYWETDANGGRNLYLSPYSTDTQNTGRRLLAKGNAKKNKETKDSIIRIFDEYGTEILAGSGNRDIIIMDEIGFLETEARKFRQAVLRRLDAETPVIGVIKPLRTALPEEIRSHPDVTVREVTGENRGEVLSWLLAKYR